MCLSDGHYGRGPRLLNTTTNPWRIKSFDHRITFKRHLFILLFACLIQTPLAHSVSIGLQPNSITASTGDSISLDLVISGLGNFSPDSLGAYDISVGFDPSIFSFTSYSLGNYLGDLSLFEAVDVSSGDVGGAVNIAEITLLTSIALDTFQPDAFTLATLNFSVTNLAAGAVTRLSVLSGSVLADAFGLALLVTSEGTASVESRASSVPIPGTALLIMAAFLARLILKRRHSD